VLSVKMLGGLTFVNEGQRVGAELGSCARMLAAYLVEFPGRVHRRERLAELFWCDRDPEQSRAALNTALWRVRKLLAPDGRARTVPFLYTSGAEVVLESAEGLSVDTHRFTGAAHKALVRDGEGSPMSMQALEEAVGDYAGPFLDGNDSDWIIAERERLHSLYVRCLSELMRIHFSDGRYENAICAARGILAVDAFRESIQRALALLLVINGQRAQAIRELRRWVADIKREIGVGPMPETIELENAIITGTIFEAMPDFTKSYFSPTAGRVGASLQRQHSSFNNRAAVPASPPVRG
jgi:DNA-binding SARP family transcriptional activator